MKNGKLITILSTIFVAIILYLFILPPINLQSWDFYSYIIMVVAFCFVVSAVTGKSNNPDRIFYFSGNKVKLSKTNINNYIKQYIFVLIIPVVVALIILMNFICSPLFMSKSYQQRITISEDGDFTKDIKQVDTNQLPLLDKDSSSKLGDRVMGQMPELVSQFTVSDLYTQINYNNDIIRVTPLEYNGFFKWLGNRGNGVKGYITVNSVTGESNLTKLDNGMKYMPSSYLTDNLYFRLRIAYPTLIFGDESFEIDNEGNPYWIVPVMSYTGVGLKEEVSEVIIFNPVNGESNKYKVADVPTWVDHVYPSSLIISQVDDWGLYKNGFFNTLFSQKDVVKTTDGYTYLAMNDDIYLYTGITSLANDESNIGFILTNLRTKKTIFYNIPGAEEYSAMASAKGQVQQMSYTSTFPLLINLNNRPTYLMSLKDNAGLVKMYAFVDVADYQKVVVTDASLGIETAKENYLKQVGNTTGDSADKTITVKSITSAVIDGTTFYYIKDTEDNTYKVSIKVSDNLPFVTIGSTHKIIYSTGSINTINLFD